MERTPSLRPQYRKALWIGLGLSVVIPAAVLVALRGNNPEERVKPELALTAEAKPLQLNDAMEMAALNTETPAPAPKAGKKAKAVKAAAPKPGPELTATQQAKAAEAFDQLVVADPVIATTQTITVDNLPEATTTSAPATPSVPVYQPGSVGKAKQGWAGQGSGSGGGGDGPGFVAGIRPGDPGHCPQPGRGRGRPPVRLIVPTGSR
jgi:hypothetical protein